MKTKFYSVALLVVLATACGKNTDYEKALQERNEKNKQAQKGGVRVPPNPVLPAPKGEKPATPPDETVPVNGTEPVPPVQSKLTPEQKEQVLKVLGG
ncbi:MAG: hypothetical protein ABL958_18995, partial [Bdellovibrionia bacterium]